MCWQVALYLKREKKKSLIVLRQMIATWSPNLLFLIIFLTSVNTGTSLSLSPQEHLLLLVQYLLPRCWPPSHPGPPSNSSFWVKLKEHYCLPLSLAWAPNQIFLLWFFSNASPQRWAAILRNWTRHQLGDFISNLKPISSSVGVQVSEALTHTSNLHGKCTVTQPPPQLPSPLVWDVS